MTITTIVMVVGDRLAIPSDLLQALWELDELRPMPRRPAKAHATKVQIRTLSGACLLNMLVKMLGNKRLSNQKGGGAIQKH